MASTQIETVSTTADKAKLAVAVLLAVGAIVAFYLMGRMGAAAQWGVLLVGLALAVGAFASSESGRQLWAFGRDSWREVKKVVWPVRKDTIQMTLYVFGFVVVMAFFLWLTDQVLQWAFYDLILGWKK